MYDDDRRSKLEHIITMADCPFYKISKNSVQFSFILKFHNIQNSNNTTTSEINYNINYSNTYN